jgi:hypothetical protein
VNSERIEQRFYRRWSPFDHARQAAPPAQALEPKTRPTGSLPADPAAVIEPAPHTTHWIVCGSCAEPITTASERISVSGRHLHDFMNP